MPFMLDTNIISYVVRNPKGPVAGRFKGIASADILTSVVVVGELAYGFAKRPSPKLERQTDAVLAGIEVVAIDAPAGRVYARIRAALEDLGTPIGANDLWIAAHALALNATLVTANEREFRRVPGLRVENWAA